MENVVLIIHLLLALGLIAVVLLQRSEGGGLGMGGGGAVSGRAAATALGKLTWLLGVAFLITSVTLTIIVARNSSDASVIDRLGAPSATQSDTDTGLPAGDSLLPPGSGDNAPLVPPAE